VKLPSVEGALAFLTSSVFDALVGGLPVIGLSRFTGFCRRASDLRETMEREFFLERDFGGASSSGGGKSSSGGMGGGGG
jgi:uncharacterized membrane protein YgcG